MIMRGHAGPEPRVDHWFFVPALTLLRIHMEAFLVSTGIVALAEIGDKTQLLAFVLAARFRRPLPIVAGSSSPPLPTTRLPPPSAPGSPA
jgi:hypothetical protein